VNFHCGYHSIIALVPVTAKRQKMGDPVDGFLQNVILEFFPWAGDIRPTDYEQERRIFMGPVKRRQ
jgi:hypothetical protein